MVNNIAEIRQSLHMKQKDLAKKLNVTLNYLSTQENKSDINGITLYKIAKALNTTGKRIFDFSDRTRSKPNFNPHMEAFWAQGCQARTIIDSKNRVIFVDRQLHCLFDDISKSVAPIRDIMYLRLFDCFCLVDYAKDVDTTESITDMELLFAGGLADIDFSFAVALMDKRLDIIQSFINGLKNTKEYRGGKEEYNNIKTIREQYGITCAALSQMANIPRRNLGMIESKSHCSDVHINVAKRIAKVLGCNFTDLYSSFPKDIYNIQARQFAENLRNEYDVSSLIAELEKDKDSLTLSVRNIVGFVNRTTSANQ